MTESTIIAKYVKSSGVMVTLDIPEEGTIGLPCELKIASMIKKGDKVVAGQTYRWQINVSAKGQRSILNVEPADEDAKFRTAKDILQQNIDAKRAEEAAANIAKQNAEIEKKAAEDKAYAETLAAEYRAKNEQKKVEKDQPPAPYPQGGIEKICADTKKRNEEAQKAIDAIPARKEAELIVHAVAAEIMPQDQSMTVREASGNISRSYSDDELLLMRNVVAKNCSEPEFKMLMYIANKYGLDPLTKQIWAIKRNDRDPALIFAGRDGFLAIAHRSGQFDGMQSGVTYGVNKEGKKIPISAWCKVWRRDMSHAFETEVPFDEYNTGFSVWKSHPSAMILKVAESVCLRKAFSIDGIYSPEEINTEQ
jgi:phage recombination protein Bet